MRVEDLETPVPVIDLDRVEHNLAKLQAYCDSHDLRLRPHIKAHKMRAFARRRVELGACGITCQKLGEAEVMVDAGLDDILISYPLIGPAKALRLAALARRTGEAEGLRFDGLMTYPSTAATAAFVAEAKRRFDEAGITISVVSGGGTPNAWQAHEVAGLTEVRVGTYIYHDRATVGAGAASLDECALLLHATVVSRPTEDRAVIDAGTKSLTSDLVASSVGPGYGLILGYPDAVIERLNEEHGVVDLSRCDGKPALGERVRIVPNHVCVVSNLHDEVVMSRDGRVVDTWRVAARGKTR